MRIECFSFDLLNVEYKQSQLTFLNNIRLKLTKRSGSTVTCVFKCFFVVFFLVCINVFEVFIVHIDFSTNLEKRNVSFHFVWQADDILSIQKNVFTDKAIASRRCSCKFSVCVFCRQRKPIDFVFDGVFCRCNLVHKRLNL